MAARWLKQLRQITVSIAILAAAFNVGAEDYSLNWNSLAGQIRPDNGSILDPNSIREYWIQSRSEGTEWKRLAIIPKTQEGETSGYSYNITSEALCYQILVVLMGWGAFPLGGEVCMDPLAGLSCK